MIGILLGLASGADTLAGDEAVLPDYFAGLRAQGLFRVAEEYAFARQSEADVSPALRAILAVELSKVFAAHAAEAGSEAESMELWGRAGEAINPLLTQRNNPRWITLRSRQATLLCDRALSEFWKSQFAPDSEPQRATAVKATRAAIDSLHSAVLDIKDFSKPSARGTKPLDRQPDPISPTARLASEELTTSEKRRLGDEIEYLTIRMNLNLARLLPVGADRAAALLDAEPASAALARHVNSDFVWPARLARAEAMRLQGDPEKAFTFAKSFASTDIPTELNDALIAEQARDKLALHVPADAIQILLDQGRLQGRLAPELRAIMIECLLASMQAAQDKGNSALVEELWQQATTQQQMIAGPWRAYIDAILSRNSETRLYGEPLVALVREGRLAAQRRDWTAAVDAYGRASQVAATEGQQSLAAEFAFTQASLEIEAGHLEDAVRLLTEYQTRFPNDARCPEAHLLAAWAIGRLFEIQPAPQRHTAYISHLREHLTRFPDSPTRFEAEWSLAVDAIQHQEWTTAIDFLEAIPNDHRRSGDVSAQLPYCYEQALASRKGQADLADWEQRAGSAIAHQVAHWPKPPAGWTLAQSQNALRWARVLLQLRDRRYADAEQLLLQILHSREVEQRELARDGTQLDPTWNQLIPAVTQLRIISLAGLGQLSEAEKMFSASTTASPDEVLAILSGLSDLAASLDESAQHDLGRVQLAAARRLDRQRSTLPAEVAGQVDRCLAEAYTATGDLPEAIAIYETLHKASPRDRTLLETIGSLSLKRGQATDLHRAKAIYRQLEAFDPAGSPGWLKNRLTVAQICLQLGETAECQKLLKVTRILYPGLGGETLLREYEELERRVGIKADTR